tara:strand:- start:945 stop:1634 length:690 start_codon:yes stop_codon:yes gene_type:complete
MVESSWIDNVSKNFNFKRRLMKIPKYLKKVRKVQIKVSELLAFEDQVKKHYEDSLIKAPVHLSRGNEKELLKIFEYVHPEDWVFASWRNHYHALLHNVNPDNLFQDIIDGRSMSINYIEPKFYTSSIVGGIIPIALGVAKAQKLRKSNKRVWCFIGDMTFETGTFYEAYKYATNFDLPLQFVVEDNSLSTNTPTSETWGNKKKEVPDDIIYYKYDRGFPHHGTGNWVLF